MQDSELLRYSRHILLPEIGIEGQENIRKSRVLIVGLGGLGAPAALYLAAAGVGTLVLSDHDRVELSNLQRQILHRTESIGQLKIHSGQETLRRINPNTTLIGLDQRLEGAVLLEQVQAADVILDCSDNFNTRYEINASCVKAQKPLVSGAAIGFTGQLSVFDLRTTGNPCYHCLFPEGEDISQTRCSQTGIFAPTTGIIGILQAAEALKLLAGTLATEVGMLLKLDLATQEWRKVFYQKDRDCRVCMKPNPEP
jgi:adenylyltransferase/sulfurtransferase